MKQIQYRLVNNKTNKVEGWLVGKTPNKELVIDGGGHTFTLPINATTNAKYRIEKVEASSNE